MIKWEVHKINFLPTIMLEENRQPSAPDNPKMNFFFLFKIDLDGRDLNIFGFDFFLRGCTQGIFSDGLQLSTSQVDLGRGL
jgi:hypothetical protein